MNIDLLKKLIRLFIVGAVIAVLCVSLSACGLLDLLSGSLSFHTTPEKGFYDETEYPYEKIPVGEIPYSVGYEAVESRYSYYQLSDGQKLLYDLLIENVYEIYPDKGDLDVYKMPQVIVDGYTLSVADIRITLRALTDDNPYLFWISQTFSHMKNSDLNYTSVQACSSFSPKKVIEMRSQLDSTLTAFYGSIPAGLTEYEREKYVHDYIIDSCVYDKSSAGKTTPDEDNLIAHNVYGALVRHSCVCEGYGMAAQLLMNGLGVDCVCLTGLSFDSSDNEDPNDAVLHLWNAVRLGDSWYHMDATWDDQEEFYQRYDYFNINDSMIGYDHTLSGTPDTLDSEKIAEDGTENMNIFIPECSDMSYNYYVYECPHLTGYNDGTFEESLYETASRAEDCFVFYVDPAYLDYDSAVEQLFTEYPQYFFRYTDRVNDRLYGYEIDDSNLNYYMDKSRSSITVLLQYY